MLNIIQGLFGKPCRKGETFQEKFYRFGYWFAVIFYLIFLCMSFVLFVASTIINGIGSLGDLFGGLMIVLMFALMFPMLFRLIYSLNLKGSLLKKED